MPDVYPGKILVERRFTAEGANLWSIKGLVNVSSDGRRKRGDWVTHGRTKEDLSAITDHFNLQVENPLNVLDQETAKSFLNSTSSGDKYHVAFPSSFFH